MVFVNWFVAGCLVALLSSVEAISEISIQGAKFFNAQGKQVFFKGTSLAIELEWLMVGIAYQRSPYDPFVNETQCQLDASLMQQLGVNAIRSTTTPPPKFER